MLFGMVFALYKSLFSLKVKPDNFATLSGFFYFILLRLRRNYNRWEGGKGYKKKHVTA